MYKDLKKQLKDKNIIFASSLDDDLDYDELIEAMTGSKRVVFDEVSVNHRDLNKRLVDCAIEVGVNQLIILEHFNLDDLETLELQELKKYLKMYPDTKQSIIKLPMFMEMLYQNILDEYELSQKDFTVMSIADVNAVLGIWLTLDNLQTELTLKGIAYDSIESYYRVFDGQKPQHKKYPIDRCDIELTTWVEFVNNKRN